MSDLLDPELLGKVQNLCRNNEIVFNDYIMFMDEILEISIDELERAAFNQVPHRHPSSAIAHTLQWQPLNRSPERPASIDLQSVSLWHMRSVFPVSVEQPSVRGWSERWQVTDLKNHYIMDHWASREM